MLTRFMRLLDVPNFLSWLWAGKAKNDLDPKILDYPTLRVVVTEKNGKPIVMVPIHNSLILDSLAFNPEATAEEKLLAVLSAVDNIGKEAYAAGIREVCFVSSDERIDESALKHGWEVRKMLRKRLKG